MSATPFLTAVWRSLAMLNYEIDPALLQPLVPPGTELDSWEGRACVSVVGFMMEDVRVRGASVPFHETFEEVNLRFYVRRAAPEGWRRGVVFVKEIVPRPAVAAVARLFYEEPYVALQMRHAIGVPEGPVGEFAVEYSWRFRERWNRLRLDAAGEPLPPVPGSEEEFITEHYWGYTARRGGGCAEYRVEHPPWRVWRARDCVLECDAAELYGARFAACLAGPPRSAFLAEGSPVVVNHAARL